LAPQTAYRVIGVRHGGVRVTLTEHLTLERAEYVKNVLADLIAFDELVVEPDDGPPALPLRNFTG